MKLPRQTALASSIATLLCALAPLHAGPSAKPLAQTKVVHLDPAPIRAEIKGAREIFLVATDAGDGFVADWATWIEPVFVKADGSRVKLTELKPKETKVGWAELGVNARSDGKKPQRVKKQDVAFGLAAHAPSMLVYDLPPGVVAFEARGGIDDGGVDQGNGATVIFQVFTERPDPAVLANSEKSSNSTTKPYGWDAALANMATFKTPPGLAATLVAAEPMIQNPTNIDVDHRGRVWAVECVNYRKYGKIRPEGDRVVVLEDTNGDGVADKETTFFQTPEVTNPLGICVLPSPTGKGTQAVVSAAPNVWLLTDKDGDDKAEEAVKIFKTTGTWDYDHQIHAFVFGPDGKFYFNMGDAATSLTWPDGTVVKDQLGNDITNQGKPYRKGMIFRCDIDLATGKASHVETLGHNFRNNYEVAVDSFGTMWQSDNDDDGNKAVRINYVMDYGNFGYTDELTGAGWRTARPNLEKEIPQQHWYQNDPGVVPNVLITGAGSPTGIVVNEGAALGGAFRNQVIHCDAGPRTTRAYPVEMDGAGYKATMVDVLTSSDPWYRVADLAVAPDGALIVADWYDPGVGGHAMGDNKGGQIRGRVYRVAGAGVKPSVPKVDVITPAGAVEALKSPNLAVRSMAWRALSAQGAKAEPALLTLWQSEDPRLRARALGVLTQIAGRGTHYLTAGLTDPDSDVRCAAVRLVRMMSRTRDFDTTMLEENQAVVGRVMRDPSPQVRREIALSLHRTKEIAKLWAMLAVQHDGRDRWYLEALGIGAAGNEDACFDAWLAMVGDKWNTPAGRDIIWRMRSAKAAGYLAKLIEDGAVADKARYLRAFDFLPKSPERTKALVDLATSGKAADEIAREALVRLKGTDLQAEPSVATALQGALERAKGTPQFIELVRDFGARGHGPALLATAVKLSGDPLAGDAVRLALADADAEKTVATALAGANADEIIALFGTTASKQSLGELARLVKNPATKTELRAAAVRALARTQLGAQSLVKLARDGQFPADLKSAAAGALAQVQYANLREQNLAAVELV